MIRMFDSLIQKIRKESIFSVLSFVCLLVTLFGLPLLFVPSLRGGFDLPKEIFLYGALSVIFVLTLFEVILTKTLRQKRTVLDWPFLLLISSAFLSTVLSLSPSVSFWGRPDAFVIHFFGLFLLLAWSWFLIQKISSEARFRQAIFAFLLSGTFASIFFLLSEVTFFSASFAAQTLNPFAKLNSVFGIYEVILFTVAIGLLLPRAKNHLSLTLLSGICALVSFIALVRLNFQILWILLCVGLGLIFLLGMAFWGKVRKIFIGLTFLLFIFSLIHILLPQAFHYGRALPTEINLNPSISKAIVEDSLTSNVQTFLFGSGPSTFIYDFSLFRPAVMNEDPYFWGVRFDAPWNSIFSWVAELGFVGVVTLFLILLLMLGLVLSAILHIRSTLWKRTSLSFADTRMEYFVFMVGWMVLTIGLFVSVFNFTLWFIWWTLVAFVVIGLSYIQPALVREREKTFDINPQYIFVFSFFFLLLSSATVVGGVLWGKIFAAEKIVYAAQGTSHQSRLLLHQALEYQPNSSEYALLLARNYFDASFQLSSTNPSESAQMLSLALDFARRAHESDPQNIQMAEVLSSTYLQTLPYTTERSMAQSIVYATEAINNAIRLEPTNPIFHSQMGMLQEFSGQFDLAEKSYKEAIGLKSNYVQGYFDLSRLYEKQNNLDAAIAVYEQYLTRDSKNAEVLYELGRLYYNRRQPGDEEKAEKLWIEGVNLQPDSSNSLYSLGLLYERRGDRATARNYFQQVQALNPENKDVQKKLQTL